ncbi:hypothetical protein K2X89_01610 [Myxococcota bacterium]|nr:hypothetical protein [Myxococcota bacterium]
MTRRLNHRGWFVLVSIRSSDGFQCVDFFEDAAGAFGFEQLLSDPEDGGRWTAFGGHGRARYGSLGDAIGHARSAIAWLTRDAGAVNALASFMATDEVESRSLA